MNGIFGLLGVVCRHGPSGIYSSRSVISPKESKQGNRESSRHLDGGKSRGRACSPRASGAG